MTATSTSSNSSLRFCSTSSSSSSSHRAFGAFRTANTGHATANYSPELNNSASASTTNSSSTSSSSHDAQTTPVNTTETNDSCFLLYDETQQQQTNSSSMRYFPLFTFESLITSSNSVVAAEPAPRPWLPADSSSSAFYGDDDEPFYCDSYHIAAELSPFPHKLVLCSPSSPLPITTDNDGDSDAVVESLAHAFDNKKPTSYSKKSSQSTDAVIKRVSQLSRAKRCYSIPALVSDDLMEVDHFPSSPATEEERARHSSLPAAMNENDDDDEQQHRHGNNASSSASHQSHRRFTRHHGHRKLVDVKRPCPFDARHIVHADQFERHLHDCQTRRFESYVRKRYSKKVALWKAERQASVTRMPSIAEEDAAENGEHHHHCHHSRHHHNNHHNHQSSHTHHPLRSSTTWPSTIDTDDDDLSDAGVSLSLISTTTITTAATAASSTNNILPCMTSDY